MAKSLQSHCSLLLACLVSFILLCGVSVVEGSHFAFGTILWTQTGTTNSAGTFSGTGAYAFNFNSAFRTDYAGWGLTPYVGVQLSIGTLYFYPIPSATTVANSATPPDGLCPSTYYNGHGTRARGYSYSKAISITVKTLYTDDWFAASSSFSQTLLANTNYWYGWCDCCRIQTLTDGNGGTTGDPEQLSGYINAATQYSPVTTALPRQYFQVGITSVYKFPVVLNNPSTTVTSIIESTQSYSLVFNLFGLGTTTTQGTNGNNFNTGDSFTAVATSTSAAGVLTWTPRHTGLFAVQVRITESTTNYIVLDLIFDVCTSCQGITLTAPATATFYPGALGSFNVVATSQIVTSNTITVESSVLPPGGSFVLSTAQGVVASKWTATYTLYWQPTLTSVGMTVCFSASDTQGEVSLGSQCTLLLIGTGNILLVTGIIRDFEPTGPGMNTAVAVDSGVTYVQNTLVNSYPAMLTTGTYGTQASWLQNHWFVTTSGESLQQAQSIVCNNALTSNQLIFRFSQLTAANSAPDNPWFPIDGLLFGNTLNSHNYFFTYEARPQFTYYQGQVFSFYTSDDLFIYVAGRLPSGWTLGGTAASSTSTQKARFDLNLDTHLTAVYGSKPASGTIVEMDIFYIHRSSFAEPYLQIDITAAPQCDSFSNGITTINLPTFSTSSMVLLGQAALTSGGLLSINGGAQADSGAAWYASGGSIKPLKLQYGFQANFTLQWSGASEGVAFVLQAAGPTARGSPGSSLGYGGASGIVNSLVVEFDDIVSADQSDPSYQHASIHISGINLPNTASEADKVNVVLGQSSSGTVLTWDNKTAYNVRIEFIPASQVSTQPYSYLNVYVNQLVLPVVQAVINATELDLMWGGSAYVGFTSGTSTSYYSAITISNFVLTVVPVSPSKSFASAAPSNIQAGTTGSMTVQLLDVCGNYIRSGGDSASIGYTIVSGPSTIANLQLTDNVNGQYTISYSPTKAGTYSLAVTYGGTAISGSPFPFVVVAGPTYAPTSLYAGLPAFSGATQTIVINTADTITITSLDKFGNTHYGGQDSWLVNFSPSLANGFTGPTAGTALPLPDQSANYNVSFSSGVSGTYQLTVTLNGLNLAGQAYTIVILAGPAYAPNCSPSGSALTSVVAGVGGSFLLTLRDKTNNLITNSAQWSDQACGTGSHASSCFIQSKSNPAIKYPITCAWSGNSYNCVLNGTFADSYTLNVTINGVLMPTTSVVTIVPGPAWAPQCIGVAPSGGVVAGAQSSGVYIQSEDQFANLIQTSLPAGASYTATVDSADAPYVTSGGQTSGTIQLAYAGQGRYALSFVCTKATSLSFTASLSGSAGANGAIGNSPFKALVIPAAPYTTSTVTFPAGSITATAGQNASALFVLTSEDQYGNLRTSGGDSQAFVTTLSDPNTGVTVAASTGFVSSNPPSQTYAGYYSYTVAGTYLLKVVLASSGTTITFPAAATSQSVTINPGVTDHSHSVVLAGNGNSGGAQGTPQTIQVQARDQYGNNQLSTVTNSWTITVTGSTPITTPLSQSGSVYTFQYNVPQAQGAFTITVTLNDGNSGLVATLNADSVPNNQVFFVSLWPVNGVSYNSAQVGVSSQFQINRFSDASWSTSVATAIPWTVTLVPVAPPSATGLNAQTYTITNTQVALTPAPNSTVTYTPQFTLPSGVLSVTLNISISLGGVAATILNAANGASLVTVSAGKIAQYLINSSTASVSPSSPFPVTVSAADSFNNPLLISSSPVPPQPSFFQTGSNTAWPATFSTAANGYQWTASVTSPPTVNPYVYSASATVGSNTYPSNLLQLNVVSGKPANVTLFSVSSSSSAFITSSVDNTATFTMTITDYEGNSISSSTAAQLTFSWGFTTSCGSTSTVTSQQTSQSIWTLTLGCHVTGTYALAPTIQLNGSPLSVFVVYGPHPSTGNVVMTYGAFKTATVGTTTPAPPITAGSQFQFAVTCVDDFNNAWAVSLGLSSTYTVTPAGTSLAGPSLLATVSDAGSAGVFNVLVLGSATQVAGTYTFSFYAAGQQVAMTAPTVQVVAGVPYLPTTLYPLSIPNGQVQQSLQYSIILRDQFSNVIVSQQASFQYSLNVFVGKPQCTAGTPSINQNPNYVQVSGDFTQGSSVWNAATNSYTITVIPQVIGTYTVIALPTLSNPCGSSGYACDVRNISCVTQSGLSTVVSAGYPDVHQSFIEGLPANGQLIAGNTLQLTVILRDVLGNWVSASDNSVITFASVLNGNTAAAVAGAVSDNQNGSFSVQFKNTTAGLWQLQALLNGTQLQCLSPGWSPLAVNNNSLLATGVNVVPCSLQVIANIPWSWTQVTGPTPIAGQLSYINLQVTDSYGNIISNPLVTYTYLIYGASQSIATYTFTGSLSCTSGTGQCQWSFLSTWGGVVQISVTLQLGPSPTCVAQQLGTANYQCQDGTCVTQISRCNSPPQPGVITLTVLAATCGATDPTTPYRCSDTQTCVSSYTQCNGGGFANATKCGVGQVTCSVGSTCAANAFACPCPNGFTRNPYTKACEVTGANTGSAPSCASNLQLCSGANTVATCVVNPSTDCPSIPVCPPGYFTCPDATCASTANGCQDYASNPTLWGNGCTNGTITCLDGTCRSSVDQCSTLVSCPAGKVLCPDNSCQASASQCYQVYSCNNANYPSTTSYRCRDGTCKDSPLHCPTYTTCQQGYVLCENGQCAATQSACAAANECGAAAVRCPDGSCRPSLYQCPSVETCPNSSPVRCSDGTCQPVLALCNAPVQCPAGTVVCPDGSCAGSLALCPAGTTCRSDEPVLCPDGSCTTDQSKCGPTNVCPTETPLRCPDGSCRVSLVDCPSRTACSTSGLPIRCFDGTCVSSSDQCPAASAFQCSGGTPLRCPDGSCAAALALCPSPVTCPIGAQLCQDGSCRASCANAAAIVCTGTANLACPSPLGVSVCVSSASQCPQFPVCPLSAPVRCLDATCAASISACPVLPDPGLTSVVPCADGSWSTSAVLCSTPVSCPVGMFKCLDNTCRQDPDDCPLWSSCSSNALAPYRCPNGACAPTPWDNSCQPSSGTCNDLTPVRCPGSAGTCVTSISLCPQGTAADPTNDPLAQCPTATTLVQCRDGTCRTAEACADTALVCPAALPVLCEVGVCAANAAQCPSSSPVGVVCPAGQFACFDGSCTSSQCPGQKTCSNNISRRDGTCIATASYPQCLFRCWDGTCASYDQTGSALKNNLCTSGGPIIVDGAPTTSTQSIGNVCPLQIPYKCNNGLCVASSTLCPQVTSSNCASAAAPFMCASGLCVADSRECPLVWSICPDNYNTNPPTAGSRCSDGTCVPDQTYCPLGREITGTYPTGSCPGNKAICPTTPNQWPGLCSTTADQSGCLVIDCPTGYASASTVCPTVAGIQQNLCVPSTYTAAQCNSLSVTVPSGNGCPIGSPVQCWDGACVQSSTQCRLYNGCPQSLPYRCTTGDQSCQLSSTQCTAPSTQYQCANGTYVSSQSALSLCTAPNGCSVLTPVRCADGTCKKYAASAVIPAGYQASDFCQTSTGCSAPLFACYDGSCAASSAQCPISTLCVAPTAYKCPSGCAASQAACNANSTSSIGECPASSPYVCPNGLCVATSALCSTGPSVGTSTGTSSGATIINGGTSASGGSASGPTQTAPNAGAVNTSPLPNSCTNTINPVLCFDGSCASSLSGCIGHGQLINGYTPPAGSDPYSDTNLAASCKNAGDVMCPNGQCVPGPLVQIMCQVIPACAANLTRCEDGSCQTTCSASLLASFPSCSFPGYEPSSRARCEDGTCRRQCLPYDGCPMWLPYQCPNRECAANAPLCSAAQVGQMWTFNSETIVPFPVGGRRLLSHGQVQILEKHIRSLRLASKESVEVHRQFEVEEAEFESVVAPHSSMHDVLIGGFGNSPCYSNCRAQVKSSGTFIINPNVDNLLTVAVANGQVQSWIQISAGTLGISGNTATITVDAVGEGTARTAENRVVLSRRSVFGSYLTFAEGIISPMLNITLDPNAKLPLSRNITIRSAVDMNWNVSVVDRCLASLLQIEPQTLNFGGWQCQGAVTQRTDLAPYIFEGTVNNNGIYAIILSPIETQSEVSTTSWAQQNAVWIALGIIGVVAIGMMVFYWMQRLHRYRGKLHEEREQVKKQREEVEEMEQFGGHAGQKDDEVEMMSNPMVVQMKDMQARLDKKAVELQQAEGAQRQAETAVRQEHITQLKSDRDTLQQELERLRSQLASQAKTTGRPVAVDVPRPTPMGMAMVGSGRSGGGMGMGMPVAAGQGQSIGRPQAHPYASPYGGYPATADTSSMPGVLPESTGGTTSGTGRTEFSPQASMRPKKKGIE